MSAPQIAVYGGSFDPPHVAHVLVACWARASAGVERVIVLPTWDHPFAKRSAPFPHRLAMCELAMRPVVGCEVTGLEQELEESRTLLVLEALQARHPGAQLRFVVGTDILPETPQWHRWDAIVQLAPPLVVGRAGHRPTADVLAEHGLEAPPLVMPELSSTELRARLGRGQSVEGLVPPAVAAYAREHGLYELDS